MTGVLDRAALADMRRPRERRAGEAGHIGLGWWIDDDRLLGRIVSHGGEVDGHSAHLAFSPAHDVGVVVLANLGGDAAFQIGDRLMRQIIIAARASDIASPRTAGAFYDAGEWGPAAWAYGSLQRVEPSPRAAHARRGFALMRLGQLDEAEQAFRAGAVTGFAPAASHYNRAAALSLAGRADEALSALEAAVDAGFRDAALARRDPDLDRLRSIPGFERVVGPMEH